MLSVRALFSFCLLVVPSAFGQPAPDPDPALKLSLLVTGDGTSCADVAWVESASCANLTNTPVPGPARVWVLATRVGGFPDGIGAVRFGITYTADVTGWTLCTGGTESPTQAWPNSGTRNRVTWPGDCHLPAGEHAVLGFFAVSDGSLGSIGLLPYVGGLSATATSCGGGESSVCEAGLASLDLGVGGAFDCNVPVVDAPTAVAATDSLCGLYLTWTHGGGADAFDVLRRGSVIATVAGDAREYLDPNVPSDVSYEYRIAARTACDVATSDPILATNTFLSAPTDVSASTDDCAAVHVAWTDNSEEDGFRVYRDGELVGTTAAGVTTFDDVPSFIGRLHEYTVVPFAGCGANATAPGAAGALAPLAASNCNATNGLCVVNVSWSDNSDTELGFNVYRDGELLVTTDPDVESYVDSTAVTTVTHQYTVEAFGACGPALWSNADAGGVTSLEGATACVATDDLCDAIHVTWQDNSDIEDGFRVFRNDTLLATVPTDSVSYVDSTGVSGLFSVRAFTSCVEAIPSNEDFGRLEPPLTIPTVLEASNGLCHLVSLSWQPGDGVADGYNVYRDAVFLASSEGPAFTDSTAVPGMAYAYAVSAFNQCLETPVTGQVGAVAGGQMPAPPTNCVASDSLCFGIDITWLDNSDDETGFVLMRDGAQLVALPPNTTAYRDESIVFDQTYSYAVMATSQCGDSNASNEDDGLGLSELDLGPPPVIGPMDGECSSTPVTFAWEAVPGAERYRILIGSTCGSGNILVRELEETQFTFSAPSGINAFWEVQALSGCDTWSSTECRAFEVTPALEPPGWVYWDYAANPGEVTFYWEPALWGVESYRVYVQGGWDEACYGEADTVYTVAGTDTTLNLSEYALPNGEFVAVVWVTTTILGDCEAESEPSYCLILCCEPPVALEYFEAATMTNGVEITWETTSENRVSGFHVYRARAELGAFTRVNASLIPAGQFEYRLLDDTATDGHRYRYRLTEYTSDGVEVTLGHVEARAPYIPKVARLLPSRPNPFNPLTHIRFEVPGPTPVTIDIFNPSGQRVRQLVSEVFPAGRHEVVWRGRDDAGREVSSGTYFVRMQAGGRSNVGRLILLR